MHPDSLCRLCVDPSKCPLCDVMRNPRPLTMRSIGAISSGRCAPAPRVTRTVDVAQVATLAGVQRNLRENERRAAEIEAGRRQAALRAEIEATKAEIAKLSRRVTVPALVPAPAPTVPPATPLPPLAAVPAPLPAPVVQFFGTLKAGDWAGLAARVDAGHLTQAEAEGIAAQWMGAFQGVTARA